MPFSYCNNNRMIEKLNIQKYKDMPCSSVTGNMVFLLEKHLLSIKNLQKIIENNMANSDIFQSDSDGSLKKCLNEYGRIIGFLVNDTLVASSTIYFPGKNSDNLGIDLSFNDDMLKKTAHLETVVVHPDYRGNSLAIKMNSFAIKHLSALNYRYICTTVSPTNICSLIVKFKLGFFVKSICFKYGGKLRYILHKDIENPLKISPDEQIQLSLSDIKNQQSILTNGFIGYKLIKNQKGTAMLFGKPCFS